MRYYKGFQKFAVSLIILYYKALYRVKVVGQENIPSEGCLLCANHPTLHDPLLAITAIGNSHELTGMGKKELFKNKIFAFVLYALGGFPVDRGKSDIKAIKRCIEAVKCGKKLIIFPEGTRTVRSGKKAKAGIGLIAMKTNCPIIPMFIPSDIKIFKKNIIVLGKAIMPPSREERISSEEFSQSILDTCFALGDDYENYCS